MGIDEAKRRRPKATALIKRDDLEIEKHDRLPQAGRENDLEMVSPTLVTTVTRTIDEDVKYSAPDVWVENDTGKDALRSTCNPDDGICTIFKEIAVSAGTTDADATMLSFEQVRTSKKSSRLLESTKSAKMETEHE